MAQYAFIVNDKTDDTVVRRRGRGSESYYGNYHSGTVHDGQPLMSLPNLRSIGPMV